MVKKLTEREQTQAECNRLMHGFGYTKRSRSIIWAAKHQRCPVCSAAPYQACINMAEVRRGIQPHLAKKNKQPHEERIDWDKLRKALKERLGV